VNSAAAIQVVIPGVVGIWKAAQLARSPQRLSLRWVVACFALATMAFAVAPYAGTGVQEGVSGTGPIWLMWFGWTLLLAMLYCLICVFVFSAGQGPVARRRALWEAVPAAATVLLLAILAATVPRTASVAEYPQATLDLFRLVANAYPAYGAVICVVWMRRYARLARPWLALGLTVASAGLMIVGLGSALNVVSMAIRLSAPTATVMLDLPPSVILVGNLVFLSGVVAPGARVRWAAARIWWRHLLDYHRLRPLWTMMNRAFPEDTLGRVPAHPWRDALSLRSVNRRFYRRVIECRDGLVRASGRLTEDRSPASPAELAGWLRHALDGNPPDASQDKQTQTVHAVAIPADGGLEADVGELVALSRELRTA
jgi:hypothetical protein